MDTTGATLVLLIFFRFIFTPGLLIGTVLWAYSLARANPLRIYAFWLGIFVSILVIILSLLTNPNFVFLPNASASFAPNAGGIVLDILAGLFAGMGAMAIIRFLDTTKAVALVITAVSAATLIGIYYVCIGNGIRDNILLITLSFVIGTIAYRVFGPGPAAP